MNELMTVEARVARVHELAAQAAAAEQRAREAGVAAWQIGVMLGYELCCLKEECGHGKWQSLFKSDSKTDTCVRFRMDVRSARRYMELYREAEGWCKRKGLEMSGGALAEAGVPAELSMRGAMQLFRGEKPTPTFTAPNVKGRIRKDEGVGEQERVRALAASATEELREIEAHLREFVQSGRHTLLEQEDRKGAILLFGWLADTFKGVGRR